MSKKIEIRDLKDETMRPSKKLFYSCVNILVVFFYLKRKENWKTNIYQTNYILGSRNSIRVSNDETNSKDNILITY